MIERDQPETGHDGRNIGRSAWRPGQIPPRGLWQVLKRVWGQIGEENLSLVAAGVAFYSLLAIFPGIAALIAVYGLIADPAQVTQQFSTLSAVLPPDAYDLVHTQMQQVAGRPDGTLGAGLAGAILLSVWSSTKGTRSLIGALNIVYREREKRGFIKLGALAYGMTFVLVLFAVIAIAMVVALPVVLKYVGLDAIAEIAVNWLRWPVLALMVLFILAVLYRYGPSRSKARWEWVSWGSVLAVVLWLIASGLFSFYVSQFGNYNATYGSVGAVIVLLLWLFITAFVTILGAAVNAELECQTERDTTRKHERPMGQRGAFVADHLPDE